MPFNGQVQSIRSGIQTVHLCTEKIFIKQIPFTRNSCQTPTLIARPRKTSAIDPELQQTNQTKGSEWIYCFLCIILRDEGRSGRTLDDQGRLMKAFLVVHPPQARIRTENGRRTEDGCRTKTDKIYPATHGRLHDFGTKMIKHYLFHMQ